MFYEGAVGVSEPERPSASERWLETPADTSALDEAVAENEARIQDLVGRRAELERLMDACSRLPPGPAASAVPHADPSPAGGNEILATAEASEVMAAAFHAKG